MKIIVDTKNDSSEQIKKVIEILSSFLKTKGSGKKIIQNPPGSFSTSSKKRPYPNRKFDVFRDF